jgi:hypothetical protein
MSQAMQIDEEETLAQTPAQLRAFILTKSGESLKFGAK